MTGLIRTRRFKMLLAVAGGSLLLGILLFFASSFLTDNRDWRHIVPKLRLFGGALATLSVVAGGFFAWRLKEEWDGRLAEVNAEIGDKGVTLCLAPRSATLPETDVVGLWRRLSVWLKRQDDFPAQYMTMEVAGNRDRVLILVRIPQSLRRGLTSEINREFPDTEIVECPPSGKQLVKGVQNSFVDPPCDALERGMSLKWTSFKMAADPAYPLYEGDKKQDQLTALLGAANNVHPQAYVGFQFLIRQAAPGTTRGWIKKAESLVPKPKQGQVRPQVPEEVKALIKAISKRTSEPVYEVEVRAWAASDNEEVLAEELRRISDSFLAEALGPFNRLIVEGAGEDSAVIARRQFPDVVDIWLTASELGSFLHLPSKKVADPYPKLVTASAKRMPPSPGVIVKPGEEKEKRVYGHYVHSTGDIDTVGQPFSNTHTHMFFIGPTGSGKSVALANNARSDFIDGKAGVLVVEPSGDVPGEIVAGVPPEYHKDIVILNPRSRQPFALNMCNIGMELGLTTAVDSVISAMRTAMGAGWDQAVRMQQLITNGLYVVMDVLNRPGEEGASMIALAQFMQDAVYREMLLSKASLQAQGAVDFWSNDYDSWNENDQVAAVSTAMRRISKWVGNALVRRTLAMPYTTIDLAEMLGPPLNSNAGPPPKMILLPLHVRMGQETKSLMGALFINYFTSTMLLRDEIPRDFRRRAALHVDEFKNFVSDTGSGVETLLAETRKYASSVNLYTQGAAQISGSVLTEVKINALTKGYFKLTDQQEARLAAGQMAGVVDPYDLQRLPPFHAYMQLAIPGGQAPPVMVRMLPPGKYEGEQPKPIRGFMQRPNESWRDLVNENHPFAPFMKNQAREQGVSTPDSLQELEAPDLLRTVYRMERDTKWDELIQTLAELPSDAFESLQRTRRQFDLWRAAELRENPGLIKDPLARILRRSEWEYGVPAWESDALYQRTKMQQSNAISELVEGFDVGTDFSW